MSDSKIRTLEAARAQAEAEGATVVYDQDNWLLLDWDNGEPADFQLNLGRLGFHYGPAKVVDRWPSKSGLPHEHCIVELAIHAPLMERVVLQTALGSDPVRSILTVVGPDQTNVLFKPKA